MTIICANDVRDERDDHQDRSEVEDRAHLERDVAPCTEPRCASRASPRGANSERLIEWRRDDLSDGDRLTERAPLREEGAPPRRFRAPRRRTSRTGWPPTASTRVPSRRPSGRGGVREKSSRQIAEGDRHDHDRQDERGGEHAGLATARPRRAGTARKPPSHGRACRATHGPKTRIPRGRARRWESRPQLDHVAMGAARRRGAISVRTARSRSRAASPAWSAMSDVTTVP